MWYIIQLGHRFDAATSLKMTSTQAQSQYTMLESVFGELIYKKIGSHLIFSINNQNPSSYCTSIV